MKTLKIVSWRVLLIGCIAALVIAGITAFRNQNQGYDYQASIAKLRRIGQALQLYREEWGVKPVDERETISDTGLPPFGLYALTQPGNPWSLPEEAFLLDQPHVGFEMLHLPVHFMVMFPSFNGDAPRSLLRERGEQLPIVADISMNSSQDMLRHPEDLEALVLRLDGSVELVRWNKRVRFDLLTK
jgi:hypothetical protein